MTSTDNKKEKELIKEMSFVRDSRPFIEEIDRLRAFINEKKSQKYQIGLPLNEMKSELTELKTKINEIKKNKEQL